MRRRAALPVLTILAAAALVWRFPPERYGFYPRCPVYGTLGLLCPGCGATRAAAALLHGRIAEALHLNALFVVGLVVALVYRAMGCRQPPGWAVAGALVLTAAFTVFRNVVG